MESNGLMLHSYNFEVEHCCAILRCSTEQAQLGRGLKSLCSEATLPIAYSGFPGSVVATHLLAQASSGETSNTQVDVLTLSNSEQWSTLILPSPQESVDHSLDLG